MKQIIDNEHDIQNILTPDVNSYSFLNTIDDDKLISDIDAILKYEKEHSLNVNIDIKSLTIEQKIKVFKHFLSDKTLENNNILINILILIRAYNSFDDSFFNVETMYYTDITEFLDIKLALKTELTNFILEFATWYYSLFSCIHKIEFNFLENAVQMPVVFQKIISTSDFMTISGIISKININNISTTYIVENAYAYISALAAKQTISSTIFNQYMSLIDENL